MAATGNEFVKLQQFKTAMDSKQPDMTGVVKASGDIVKILTADGAGLPSIGVGDLDSNITAIGTTGIDIQSADRASIAINASKGAAVLSVGNGGPVLNLSPRAGQSAQFLIGSKYVTSITDDASTGSSSALVTAKAVKDYVDAKDIPQASTTQYGTVKFASDEDFKAYMGIS